MSESLFGEVGSVFYGEGLSKDFNHVEAILRIDKKKRESE